MAKYDLDNIVNELNLDEVELFGLPALFSNGRIADEDIPDGLYRYDLRGSDYDPGMPIAVEKNVLVNHAGTVLLPLRISFLENDPEMRLFPYLNFSSDKNTVETVKQMRDDFTLVPDMISTLNSSIIQSNENMLWTPDNSKMNYYALYQLKDDQPYEFMGMDFANKHNMEVKGDHYEMVYGGIFHETDSLESIYRKFNVDHPKDFCGHSASVSDVLVIKEENKPKAYYVDSVSYAELPKFIDERKQVYTQYLKQEYADMGLDEYNEDMKEDMMNFSCQAAKDCKKAIEKTIDDNYSYEKSVLNVEDAINGILDDYGPACVEFVLATTVCFKDYDGRLSPDTKRWATEHINPQSFSVNHPSVFVVDSHPGLVDTFIRVAEQPISDSYVVWDAQETPEQRELKDDMDKLVDNLGKLMENRPDYDYTNMRLLVDIAAGDAEMTKDMLNDIINYPLSNEEKATAKDCLKDLKDIEIKAGRIEREEVAR